MQKSDLDDNQLSREQINDLVKSVPSWGHTITLPYGIKTPGVYQEEIQNWTAQAIPVNLTGLTVLDVGALDGYHSFLCEKRGATVTAIDSLMHGGGLGGFNLCKELLKSKVRFIKLDVYDVESLNTSFDIVLYFGVYYHLKNPLLAFEKLYKMTNLSLLIEGHFIDIGGKPLMVFFPGGELNGDASNWWSPNQQCLEDMCKVAGFKDVTIIAKRYDDDTKVYNERHGRILIKADV